MAPKIPAGPAIPEDMLVDGFVADSENSRAAQVSGHLLWAPVATQQHLDGLPIIRAEAAPLRTLDRRPRAILAA